MPAQPRQHLVELADIPQSSVGAPIPLLLADESSLFVLYCAEDIDPAWDGAMSKAVGLDTAREPCAALVFESCYAHRFGPPNDEAIEGHPLYPLGLTPYAAFQVENSAWIAEMERMNSVHPKHSADSFSTLKHFIFTFHDSTLEVASNSFETHRHRGPIRALAAEYIKRFR